MAKTSEVLSTRGRVLTATGMLAVAAGFIVPVVVGDLASAPAAPNPPGNNGTVKVDRDPFDAAPNNEPHVGCTFQIDFYGFDEGDLSAHVTFESHPPTGPTAVLLTDDVFIGDDDNSGGGSEAGLDASETYTLDLSGIDPHPIQGWHVKLTINADGSKGADVKHKVFWVSGCAPPPTTSSSSSSSTSSVPSSSSSSSSSVPSSSSSSSSSVPSSSSSSSSSSVPPSSSSSSSVSSSSSSTSPASSSSSTPPSSNAEPKKGPKDNPSLTAPGQTNHGDGPPSASNGGHS